MTELIKNSSDPADGLSVEVIALIWREHSKLLYPALRHRHMDLRPAMGVTDG